MKNNDVSRCRKCGKVIVGSSKLGYCDSCFSKQGTTAGIWGAVGFFAYKNRKKIIEGGKKVIDIIKAMKK